MTMNSFTLQIFTTYFFSEKKIKIRSKSSSLEINFLNISKDKNILKILKNFNYLNKFENYEKSMHI
jgi:hypothetical protein